MQEGQILEYVSTGHKQRCYLAEMGQLFLVDLDWIGPTECPFDDDRQIKWMEESGHSVWDMDDFLQALGDGEIRVLNSR